MRQKREIEEDRRKLRLIKRWKKIEVDRCRTE